MNLLMMMLLNQTNGGGTVSRGSGTESDPYNWYGILDSNNPNGCHTEAINQNSEEGWIKVKLEGGVTYKIGMDEGDLNSFDEFMYIYHEDGVSDKSALIEVDDNYITIDGIDVDCGTEFYIENTGYYYIKIKSYGDGAPDNLAYVHCEPAPINENKPSVGERDMTIIEVNSSYESYLNLTIYPINSWADSIKIDWGDGNGEEFSCYNYEMDCSHSYSESGVYTVIIQSKELERIKFTNSWAVTKAIQCGSSLSNYEQMFYSCKNLSKIEETFQINNNPSYLGYMFYDCDSLESIDHNLLPDYGILIATYMFGDCDNLNAIKNLVIPGNVSGHELGGMFNNCNLLLRNAFDFDSFFKNDNWTAWGDYMFQSNNSWRDEIPSQYFWDSDIWLSHDGMFSNDSLLDNYYSSIPSDWK